MCVDFLFYGVKEEFFFRIECLVIYGFGGGRWFLEE